MRTIERPHTGKLRMRQCTNTSNNSIKLTERGDGGGLVNKRHTEILKDGFGRFGLCHED